MEAAEQLKGKDGPGMADAGSDLPSVAARRRAAVELVRNHRTLLMASARRVSLCTDDAEDALQRGLEILLSKAPTADTRRLLPWARTVIRNEALAIRRTRERTLGRPTGMRSEGGPDEEDRDWVASLPSERRETEDVVEGREFVARSREALALLKPQELKALTQLASGMSYAEIARTNDWTRTKVNRCLAEGREKLRSVVEQSEAGERCHLVEPLISAAADGELSSEEADGVRNHLAVCGGCRATLREYRRIPAAVASAGPLLAIADGSATELEAPGLLARLSERVDEASLQAWMRLNGLFGGGDSASATVFGVGGARGIGTTAIAKVAAICVGTAGGAAACLGTGLVSVPGEREATPAPAAIQAEAPPQTGEVPTGTTPAPVEPPADRPVDGEAGTDPVETAPPPDPVVAEFSPGAGSTTSAAAVAPAPAPSPPPPVNSVPLGGSGEFGP